MPKPEQEIQPDLTEENESIAFDEAVPGSERTVIRAGGQVATINPSEPSRQIAQADRLLELAISQGADLDRVEKLLDLKERYEREEARKAFTAAMAAFKAEAIVIKKDRHVHYDHRDGNGQTDYWHASIGNVVNTIVPFMSKHGLSHRWESEQRDGQIHVRCIITHAAGHSESTQWWSAGADNSGKKNPIQQIASTKTYLQRYTILEATGLAVEDQDDDGARAGDDSPQTITADQANEIHAMVTDNNLDMEKFKTWLATSASRCTEISDIPAQYFDVVMRNLKRWAKAVKS